jgi:hypothetical protein
MKYPIWVCFGLVVLVSLPAGARARRSRYSAERGGLMFTVTKVEILASFTEPESGRTRTSKPQSGDRFVLVHVQVRNVGREAKCAPWFRAVIQATFGVARHHIRGC